MKYKSILYKTIRNIKFLLTNNKILHKILCNIRGVLLTESILGVTRQQVSSQYMAHSYVKLSLYFTNKIRIIFRAKDSLSLRSSECHGKPSWTK